MASVLDKELILYFTRLNEPQKRSLLAMMKSFLKPDNNSLQNVTIAQYNKDLNEAMRRIDDGIFTTIEDLEKEMERW